MRRLRARPRNSPLSFGRLHLGNADQSVAKGSFEAVDGAECGRREEPGNAHEGTLETSSGSSAQRSRRGPRRRRSEPRLVDGDHGGAEVVRQIRELPSRGVAGVAALLEHPGDRYVGGLCSGDRGIAGLGSSCAGLGGGLLQLGSTGIAAAGEKKEGEAGHGGGPSRPGPRRHRSRTGRW